MVFRGGHALPVPFFCCQRTSNARANFQHVGAVKAMALPCCHQGYSRLNNIRFKHLSYPLPDVKFTPLALPLTINQTLLFDPISGVAVERFTPRFVKIWPLKLQTASRENVYLCRYSYICASGQNVAICRNS